MKFKINNIIFWLVMVVLTASPVYMIYKYEKVWNNGKIFRFVMVPVDPNDAFRGKYVSLTFAGDTIKISKADSTFMKDDKVYVSVDSDKKGFAVLSSISKTLPENQNYFIADFNYSFDKTDTITHTTTSFATISIPFDRFYVNESNATGAETAYRNATKQKDSTCYADVALYNGQGIVKELYIGGMPLQKYLDAYPTGKK